MALKKIEVKDGSVIPYVWKTERLGRAEFQFCPIWKYGKLRELFIYPKQQENKSNYWHLHGLKCIDFQLKSWTHKGIENPWAWLYFWCEEHKCMGMNVYVPLDTSKLLVSVSSGLTIIFE